MKTHYRTQRVLCNGPATNRLLSTKDPRKVSCKLCRRILSKGLQESMELAPQAKTTTPRAMFKYLVARGQAWLQYTGQALCTGKSAILN